MLSIEYFKLKYRSTVNTILPVYDTTNLVSVVNLRLTDRKKGFHLYHALFLPL